VTHGGGSCLAVGDGEHSVTIDYPLEPGQAVASLTPLKLLLVSLAGCAGHTTKQGRRRGAVRRVVAAHEIASVKWRRRPVRGDMRPEITFTSAAECSLIVEQALAILETIAALDAIAAEAETRRPVG
jgi:uncharacterized OsmC-like protein